MNQNETGLFELIENIIFHWCNQSKKPEDKPVKEDQDVQKLKQ